MGARSFDVSLLRLGSVRLPPAIRPFLGYPIEATRVSADILHVVDHAFAHAAALTTRRTIVTCHDLMSLRASTGDAGYEVRRQTLLRFRFSVGYLRKVAHVVCDSRATQRDVVGLLDVPKESTRVIAPGVGATFAPLGPEMRDRGRGELLAGHRQIVLAVDSGAPYKRFDRTLQVVGRLYAGGADVRLIRVGPQLSASHRALADRLGILDRVWVPGWIDDAGLRRLYACAHVLLFPSSWEGFGWPVLEAMACGTPVVTSRAPAVLELVEGMNLDADAGDIERLATLVEHVLMNEATRDQACEEGLRRAARYTWARTADAYARLYEEVLAAAS